MSLLDAYIKEIKRILEKTGSGEKEFIEFESNFIDEYNEFIQKSHGTFEDEELQRKFLITKENPDLVARSLVGDDFNLQSDWKNIKAKKILFNNLFSVKYLLEPLVVMEVLTILVFFMSKLDLGNPLILIGGTFIYLVLVIITHLYQYIRYSSLRNKEFIFFVIISKLGYSLLFLGLFLWIEWYFETRFITHRNYLIIPSELYTQFNVTPIGFIFNAVFTILVIFSTLFLIILFRKEKSSHPNGLKQSTILLKDYDTHYWETPIKIVLLYSLLVLIMT
jgi:hypothetical protein